MAAGTYILVVASQHSFLGAVENRGLRVLDVLNDLSSQYVDLHDVTVRRRIQGECVKQLQRATIPKSAVDFVLLEANKHEAPLRRSHAYISKEPRGAFILLGDFEIEGSLMTKWSSDTIRTLQQDATAFFPVTSAKLSRVDCEESPITAGTALVNGLKITLLHLNRALEKPLPAGV